MALLLCSDSSVFHRAERKPHIRHPPFCCLPSSLVLLPSSLPSVVPTTRRRRKQQHLQTRKKHKRSEHPGSSESQRMESADAWEIGEPFSKVPQPFPPSFSPLKRKSRGFPGGAVVGSLPADAGDAGSGPGLGGSHMPRSDWAREPQLLSLHVWSLCSATREAAIVRGPCTAMKNGPHLLQLEKALAQKRRPNTAINTYINK